MKPELLRASKGISAALLAAAFIAIVVFLAVQAGSYAIHYAFFFPTAFSWSRTRNDLWQFLAFSPYIFAVAAGLAFWLAWRRYGVQPSSSD